MLFHTSFFLFVFLPITLAAYFILGRWSWRAAIASLALASFIFYGTWSPIYVVLIGASITVNYLGSLAIDRLRRRGAMRQARWTLGLFIAANLILLGYFKYLNFFLTQLDGAFGTSWDVAKIVLPIGISFYTFTQIAYLVDTLRNEVSERTFLTYILFVSYFPHLVAGPLLHHSEMMPQFAVRSNLRFNAGNFAMGLAFVAFGMFKKVVFADGLAPMANSAFSASAGTLSATAAWLGALAYTMQIYFDFSGYSDMAVGFSLFFNVKLPINFFSPYRATSIIDFWHRWHMTLSRFLRDYLYIPLGGNRLGEGRRTMNLLVTMLLGGLWHGANWTFVAWGLVHAIYLGINHQWRKVVRARQGEQAAGAWTHVAGWILTFVAVVVAWVFFRAHDLESAFRYLGVMFGIGGGGAARPAVGSLKLLAVALMVAWLMPNTNQIMRYAFGAGAARARIGSIVQWQANPRWGIFVGLLILVTAIVGVTSRDKLAFLYFQF